MTKIILFSVLFMFVLNSYSSAKETGDTNVTTWKAIFMFEQELEQFLGSRNDLEMPDDLGFTVLHGVALLRDSRILKMWVDAGANVNATDKLGNTPIFFAVLDHRIDNIRILVDAGIDINHKNNDGENILLYSLNRPDMVRTETAIHIVNLGVDVNALTSDGKSALYLLRDRKDYKWTETETALENLLVGKGARDIEGFNGQDTSKRTGTKTKSDRHTDSQSSPSCSNTNRQGSRRTYESRDDNEDCNQQDNYNPIR